MKYPVANKNKIKAFRSIIQGLILLLLFWLLFRNMFNVSEYSHHVSNSAITNEDNGFIALSYFAVDRAGTNTMISTERLDEHFEALKRNGYITLTQRDIENYYANDQNLPSKSMFLMFEDGRRDTALFSGPLLEKYNYIGTVMSYGNKLKEKDPKFLNAKDIKTLEKSSYYEMGTNGYRLSYINVFDRYDNFLGELSPEEFTSLSKYIDKNYNHYLMDFIRDEHGIPSEDYDQMENRITEDYLLMDEIYKRELGMLPRVYALMHSNTGRFATDKNVSIVNEKLIKQHFSINFNREGSALNDRKTDPYDLTRIQPQAYWYPNHLLMKIKADTNEDLVFIDGDPRTKRNWDIITGTAEFRKSSIIITSNPEGNGLIRLNKCDDLKDFTLHTTLTGNKLGTQGIYLRADEDLKSYICIKIRNNQLHVEESGKELFHLNLAEHDGTEFQTMEENHLEALQHEYTVYKQNTKRRKDLTKMKSQKKIENDAIENVQDGSRKYIPELQINELGNRKLSIYLNKDELTIEVDGKAAVKGLPISRLEPGYIYLESSWAGHGFSQRNICDDIYDGVFEDIVITDADNRAGIIYINKLQGTGLLRERIINRWNKIINWFIEHL